MRRQRLKVVTDGDEWPDVPYLALVAGATPDIGFGFKAFARCAEQPGSFHAVGLTAGLLPLALALPRIHRGAPWRRALAQDEVARELVAEGGRTVHRRRRPPRRPDGGARDDGTGDRALLP